MKFKDYLNETKKFGVDRVLPTEKNRITIRFKNETPIDQFPSWMRDWGLNPGIAGHKWGRGINYQTFWIQIPKKGNRNEIIDRIKKKEGIK